MKIDKKHLLMQQKNYQELQKTWGLLKGLRPQTIDLSRIDLIRQANINDLEQIASLSSILLELGLNDEGLQEFPVDLHHYCGRGLLIWQYPIQFAPYLIMLSKLKVRSYLELGIRHGGSYIATVELLNRFQTLDFSIGVDIIPCSAMTDYQSLNSKSRFICMNSQTDEFLDFIQSLSCVDLVFIDSHHQEDQCRKEFFMLSEYANMIALHDISNQGCQGIAKVWQEIKGLSDWVCFEFTSQYLVDVSFMGIGLAIKNGRLNGVR